MANPKANATFASRLLKLRATLGLTQRQLAVEFRVSPGAVALWEAGARNLSGPATRLLELYEESASLDAGKRAARNAKIGNNGP